MASTPSALTTPRKAKPQSTERPRKSKKTSTPASSDEYTILDIDLELPPPPKGYTYIICPRTPEEEMPLATTPEGPDAGSLCDKIHILARHDVGRALKNGTPHIAPAAEMTLAGLREAEQEAFEALLEVYAIGYQRIVDELDEPEKIPPGSEIRYGIDDLHELAGYLGAVQAEKDMKKGIVLESGERRAAAKKKKKAALRAAEMAVRAYYEVCASHYLWEIENAGGVSSAEEVEKVSKVANAVKAAMKDSGEHGIGDGDVSPVLYAGMLAEAEKWVEDGEAVAASLGEAVTGDGGNDYPQVNPGTASESMWG